MANWPSQKLKGESQVLPRVCPNCLREANVELRYGYKGLKGWLTNTTYYQSFLYCEPCADQVMAQRKLGLFRFWFCVLGFFGGLIAFAFAADTKEHSVLPLLAPIAVIAVLVAGYRLIRSIKRKKSPKRDDQAVWGIAAVYYGSGLDMSSSIFRAARPEWLAALVAANPDKVDDDTFQKVVGRAKPTADPNGPFGGGQPAEPAAEAREPQAASPFGG